MELAGEGQGDGAGVIHVWQVAGACGAVTLVLEGAGPAAGVGYGGGQASWPEFACYHES